MSAPDEPLIGVTSPDRCPSCGADMAPDQRYCVDCGNRRGKPRFSLDNSQAPVKQLAPPPQRKPTHRFSPSATLLSGLAVLLLALGVGWEIGNNGSAQPAAAAPLHVTIKNGDGGAATTPTTTTAGSGTQSTKSSTSGTSKATGGVVKVNKKAALNGTSGPTTNYHDLHTKAQRKAAEQKNLNTKVQEGDGKTLAPESQKLGGKCSDNEIGCQNGKYTGSWINGS